MLRLRKRIGLSAASVGLVDCSIKLLSEKYEASAQVLRLSVRLRKDQNANEVL